MGSVKVCLGLSRFIRVQGLLQFVQVYYDLGVIMVN